MDVYPFQILFPEIALTETRLLNITGSPKIPEDDYNLIEFYCPDPNCDCQRVMLTVISRKEMKMAATILYIFEGAAEYAAPCLDPRRPKSVLARAMLGTVVAHMQDDPDYVLRLKAHYALVKAAMTDPQHPAQQNLIEWKAELRAAEKRAADMDKAIRIISEHEPAFMALERKTKRRRHAKR